MPYVPGGVPPIKNPEPGFEYRWLADDNERLSLHLVGHGDRPGFMLVQGKTVPDTRALAKKLLGTDVGLVNELLNRIQFGRLILGKIPAAEAGKRRAEMKAATRDRVGATRDEFLAQHRRGIKPFVDEVEAIQDRQRFAQREGNPRVSLAGIDVPSRGDEASE